MQQRAPSIRLVGSGGGYAVWRGLTTTPDFYAGGVDIVGRSDLKTLFASFVEDFPPREENLISSSLKTSLSILAVLIVFVEFAVAVVAAQDSTSGSMLSPEITNSREVQSAFQYIDTHKNEQLAEWIKITEIPSPSKQELERSNYIMAEMKKAGLDSVTRDEIGNVIGVLKGDGHGPTVVFAAHMDTVFPASVAIKVRRDGDTLYAPGVGDDSASDANMLQAIRAIKHARTSLQGDIVFLGTVQEELGFNGIRYFLQHANPKPDMLVALDGELRADVDYGALGIRWLKFSYTGPGSHTLFSKGAPNPNRAVARAIEQIYQISIPDGSDAVYNVGMIGGGRVFNAAPEESYFTVDLRTVDPVLLESLSRSISAAAEQAALDEHVHLQSEIAANSPAGGTDIQNAARRDHPIVKTGVSVLSYLLKDDFPTMKVHPENTGSTDGNVGVAMGIPTIAIGRTFGKNQHTLQESAQISSTFIGTKAIVLLAFSLAELSPVK